FPEPVKNPPPWICTMTGRCELAVAPAGAQTFRKRQSSLEPAAGGPSWSGDGWMHSSPKAVAASVVVQGAGGCGGSQRSEPTGGDAEGVPSHSVTPLSTMPQ